MSGDPSGQLDKLLVTEVGRGWLTVLSVNANVTALIAFKIETRLNIEALSRMFFVLVPPFSDLFSVSQQARIRAQTTWCVLNIPMKACRLKNDVQKTNRPANVQRDAS